MPDVRDVQKMMNIQLTRLKQVGKGVRVSRICGNRVLVKTVVPLTEFDEFEKKGLYLPEKHKAEYTPLPNTGWILGVGDGVRLRSWWMIFLPQRWRRQIYQEGDMILFPKVAGMDFQIGDQDLRILHSNDIMSVLADTDESVVEVKSVPEAASRFKGQE